MAFDFPNAPTVGQVTTTPAGVQFKWDGTKWVTVSGGTITSISAGTGITATPNPIVATGTIGMTVPVSIANGGTGSTTAAAAPFVEVAGDTMTGILTVAVPGAADTGLELNKSTSGRNSYIQGKVGGFSRWVVVMGDAVAETGSNAGSNFLINRSADAGAFIDTNLQINRASGTVTIGNTSNTVALVLTIPNSNVAALRFSENTPRIWEIAGAGGALRMFDATAGATRLIINPDGSCWSTNGTWNSLSDAAVKRDVEPYTRGLAELVQLAPVSFYYNGKRGSVDDGIRQYGLVAQEVEPLIPEAVSRREWADAEGKPAGEVLGVDSGRLIYAVLNALKEIEVRLKTLESAR